MSVSSLEIPLTYHNISEELNNNVFRIQIDSSNSGPTEISGNITLITGMYEARYAGELSTTYRKAVSIKTEVNRALNSFINGFTGSSSPDISNLASDLCNNLTYNINTRSGFSFFKYDLTNDGSNNIQNLFDHYSIKIDFDVNNNERILNQTTRQEISTSCYQNKIYQKLGWQLGFREKNITLDSSNDILVATKTECSVLSRSICYINYPRYIYIAIDDFQSSSRNYFSIASESIIAPNIIGRINILSLLEEKTAFKQAAAPGDFNYTNKHIREYFGPTDINKLKISILDEYGRPFTLNNMDWSFILSFECFYN